jgi:hypothetical protein
MAAPPFRSIVNGGGGQKVSTGAADGVIFELISWQKFPILS